MRVKYCMVLGILKWFKSKKNIFKIVSNYRKGTIRIFDKKGKILFKKTNVSKDQLKKIEDSFVDHIDDKLSKNKKSDENSDPMIT